MPLAAPPRRVLVVQRRLPHYRIPFFDILRRALAAEGLELALAYGEPTVVEASKNDSGSLDWAMRLPTRYFLRGRLCWQPFRNLARDAALTIVTAENKLICNLFEQFGAPARRVALWGHGANLQGDRSSWRESFKSRVALRADWWFAYTDMSRGLVERLGFPSDRITVLDNAVDTAELKAQFASVTTEAKASLRELLKVGQGPVGVFIGSLYEEKRIEFLLDAALAIRAVMPSFELLVIGTGPQISLVDAASAMNPWIKALGVLKGAQKAAAASLGDVMLNPGLVGLNILDSFAGGLPMLTTDCGLHSPEIAYLEPGRNGEMTVNKLDAYVQATLNLLQDSARCAAMRTACLEDANRYTLAHMSQRFTEGVLNALAAPIRRGRR